MRRGVFLQVHCGHCPRMRCLICSRPCCCACLWALDMCTAAWIIEASHAVRVQQALLALSLSSALFFSLSPSHNLSRNLFVSLSFPVASTVNPWQTPSWRCCDTEFEWDYNWAKLYAALIHNFCLPDSSHAVKTWSHFWFHPAGSSTEVMSVCTEPVTPIKNKRINGILVNRRNNRHLKCRFFLTHRWTNLNMASICPNKWSPGSWLLHFQLL